MVVTWALLPNWVSGYHSLQGFREPREQSPSRWEGQAKNTVPGGGMPIITALPFCFHPPPLPGLKTSPRIQTRWVQLSLPHRPRAPGTFPSSSLLPVRYSFFLPDPGPKMSGQTSFLENWTTHHLSQRLYLSQISWGWGEGVFLVILLGTRFILLKTTKVSFWPSLAKTERKYRFNLPYSILL